MNVQKRPPLRLSHGEVVCPRKSNPFPGVIGYGQCISLHDQRPEACAVHGCAQFLSSEAEAEERRKRAEAAEALRGKAVDRDADAH